MRRFLSPRIPSLGEPVTLEADVSHHLLRVTGIAPGEGVELFDGMGGACIAELQRVDGGCAVLVGMGPAPSRGVGRSVWLLAAQLRSAAFDNLIRMSTELGVTRVVPVHTERVVARGDRLTRWNRIASQAAGQSGRAIVPEILSPVPLDRALQAVPESAARFVCVPGAEPLGGGLGPVALLIGPEGGLTPDEIAQVMDQGFVPGGLGPTVLRADTAGVVAVSRVLGRSVPATPEAGKE